MTVTCIGTTSRPDRPRAFSVSLHYGRRAAFSRLTIDLGGAAAVLCSARDEEVATALQLMAAVLLRTPARSASTARVVATCYLAERIHLARYHSTILWGGYRVATQGPAGALVLALVERDRPGAPLVRCGDTLRLLADVVDHDLDELSQAVVKSVDDACTLLDGMTDQEATSMMAAMSPEMVAARHGRIPTEVVMRVSGVADPAGLVNYEEGFARRDRLFDRMSTMMPSDDLVAV